MLNDYKQPENLLQLYDTRFAPKFEDIDIYLKSKRPLTVSVISKLLCISQSEVLHIIKNEDIPSINTFTFYTIMKNGSSQICQLFKRELDRGCPYLYSPEDISYIYNVDLNVVKKAFKHLEKNKVNTIDKKTILELLPPVDTN